jgi:hypothetical protein
MPAAAQAMGRKTPGARRRHRSPMRRCSPAPRSAAAGAPWLKRGLRHVGRDHGSTRGTQACSGRVAGPECAQEAPPLVVKTAAAALLPVGASLQAAKPPQRSCLASRPLSGGCSGARRGKRAVGGSPLRGHRRPPAPAAAAVQWQCPVVAAARLRGGGGAPTEKSKLKIRRSALSQIEDDGWLSLCSRQHPRSSRRFTAP